MNIKIEKRRLWRLERSDLFHFLSAKDVNLISRLSRSVMLVAPKANGDVGDVGDVTVVTR